MVAICLDFAGTPYWFLLLKSNKHKIVQKAALTSSKVNIFFTSLKANDKSLKLAAKEPNLTLAIHTFMHKHSFNSMTCTANFIHLFIYYLIKKNTLIVLKQKPMT